MPFRIDSFPKGHDGMAYPHFMLYNLNKKEYAKKVFKTRDSAINFAKNSIRFREKKDSVVDGNRVLPVGSANGNGKKKGDKKKREPKKVASNYGRSKSGLSDGKIKCC